jgi:hypothetical protein
VRSEEGEKVGKGKPGDNRIRNAECGMRKIKAKRRVKRWKVRKTGS